MRPLGVNAFVPGAVADPYWESVILLLNGNGLNNGQNNTYKDDSANNYTVTRSGNPAQGSMSPYDSGGGSYTAAGASDYLTVAGNANLSFGTGDFTVEYWIRLPATGGGGIGIDFRAQSTNVDLIIAHGADGSTQWAMGGVNSALGPALAPLVWHHIAMTRIAGQARLFCDGILVVGPVTSSHNLACGANRPVIGTNGFGPGSNTFIGSISDIRVIKGTAIYTAPFVPPTVPLGAIAGTQLLCKFGNASIVDSARKQNLLAVADVKTSTTKLKWGTASLAYDGVGDAIFVPGAQFAFGTADFTIEAWINVNNAENSGGALIFDGRAAQASLSVTLFYISNCVCFMTAGGTRTQSAVGTLQNGVWTHVAVSRKSGMTRVFVNGVNTGTPYADVNNYVMAANVGIGECPWTTSPLNGYMDDFRVTKGVGRYVNDFTPPSGPFADSVPIVGDDQWNNVQLLLHGDTKGPENNNVILDHSANGFAVTRVGNPIQGDYGKFPGYGSIFMTDPNTYLTLPNNAAFNMGTGDFTFECWIWLTGDSPANAENKRRATIFSSMPTSGTITDGWYFMLEGDASTTGVGGFLLFKYVGAAGEGMGSSAFNVTKNAWHHIALTRSGANTSAFFDGAWVSYMQFGNQTWPLAAGMPLKLGKTGYAGYEQDFLGYMTNVRIIKGFAAYSSTFTPPTAPPGLLAGTSALLNFNNAAVVDSTKKSNVHTSGGAKVSGAVRKWGQTSLAFGAVADYMQMSPNAGASWGFGTSDFTVEFWVNLNGVTSSQILVDFRPQGAAGAYFCVYLISTNSMRLHVNGGDVIIGGGLAIGTWHHIAVSRNNAVTRMYIDGVQTGANYADTNSYQGPAGRPVIGGSGAAIGSAGMIGFIEDLRVTQYVGRYPANFTPPSGPFPNFPKATMEDPGPPPIPVGPDPSPPIDPNEVPPAPTPATVPIPHLEPVG